MTKFNIDKVRNPEEAKTYKYLKHFERKYKFEVDYETEELPYTVQKIYLPDFVLSFKNGRKMYIEFKGYLRREDEVKLLAVRRALPDADIRIAFMKDNKLAGRKMRYSAWATKHGFPHCFGEIPEE